MNTLNDLAIDDLDAINNVMLGLIKKHFPDNVQSGARALASILDEVITKVVHITDGKSEGYRMFTTLYDSNKELTEKINSFKTDIIIELEKVWNVPVCFKDNCLVKK